MFFIWGGGEQRARVARWALTSYQYGPGSNRFINTINNMVDEEPLCGPYSTSKSWVWVSEILLYFIYFLIFLFTFNILVTDHVNRRCGKNNGRDTGRHWISKSMYNYLNQGADTEDEPQQDLCKNLLVSHPIFFIYCQKLKVTCISVQTVMTYYIKSIIICYNTLPYIKTGKYFNSREKRRKK